MTQPCSMTAPAPPWRGTTLPLRRAPVRSRRSGALVHGQSFREKPMGWLDFLRRRPPRIDAVAELSVFIDERAAFLVQKGIYEYARARAGHYSKILFREREFLDAVERARWQAYP